MTSRPRSEPSTQAPTAVVELVARDGGVLVRRAGRDQSMVWPAEPLRLAFDYMRRLADVVDLVVGAADPLRVLHVGGAGLSLARYVAAARPGSLQVVLEPDVELVALVRARLPLPPRSGIKVRPVTGEEGLPQVRDGWADVVLVDAFDESGRMPAALLEPPALCDLDRVRALGGAVAVNVAEAAPFDGVRTLLRHVRTVPAEGAGRAVAVAVGAEPATLRGRRPGNVVVVWGDPLLVSGWSQRASAGVAPYRVLDADAARDRFG